MHVDPFRRPSCPAAWRAEDFSYYSASWQLAGDGLDSAALRLLLERAQLPRAELRHMGVPDWLLTPANPLRWVPLALAVPLLGRIAWDASRGDAGAVWCGHELAVRDCLGRAVIREYFTP